MWTCHRTGPVHVHTQGLCCLTFCYVAQNTASAPTQGPSKGRSGQLSSIISGVLLGSDEKV